jgi:DNA ligase (NAD+)
MGSLDKIKNSDNASLLKFIKTQVKNVLNISAKVDGISSVACYKYGKLVSLLSRGDGYEGMDYTDKAKYINGLPNKIDLFAKNDEIYIRGELVILDSEEIDTDTNYRNICAGYMNSKYWNKEDISKISFIPYSILGDTMSKRTQFEVLKSVGFNCAWNESIDITEYDETTINDLAEYLTERAKLKHDYSCDGLVLMDWYACNEQDIYRPKNSMAFKINELTAITKLIDIVWEGPSKDGFFCPVGILDPVELGGAMISRASLHNLDIIDKLGIKYGSSIEILKSGDIIPKIVSVVENSNNCMPIDIPSVCPCCGKELVRDGINMRCTNKMCGDQVIHQITHFIKKLGVKSASNATLNNFGINSFDKLIAFVPNKKYKSEVKLYDELYSKVFSQSKSKLLTAMNFVGLAEISINKIIDHYGYDTIENNFDYETAKGSLPNGIGDITLQKFIEGLPEALLNVNNIVNDVRWHYTQDDSSKSTNIDIKGSICVTGSLKFGSRNKFLEFAKEHGYESKSGVSKGLTYLINNDVTSNSSKNKKAKELGIKILSEDDFIKLINADQYEASVFDL